MAKRIQSNCKIYLKTFSCIEDYMKPSSRNPPDHFILHVGTNDLSSGKSSMEIAESTINLACRLKNEIYDVSVSTIILRTDDKKLDEEGMEVNLRGRIFSQSLITSYYSVVISQQLLVTSYQSQVASYQALVTSHQSLFTSHQSLVTSHQLLVTSHQLLVTSCQSLVNSCQRLVSSY